MVFKDIFVYPKYPDNLSKLYVLSQNLWCTWNYEAIDLFYRIDPQLFRKVNHNPVEFLLGLPKTKIDELSKDRGFLFDLERVWQKFQDYITDHTASKDNIAAHGLGQDDVIAYFAMEFGLHECIPIYGGGLGILSGDFLKAASDLRFPLVGVGLVYKFGYFTQRINLNGFQEELFIEFKNHLIPMQEARLPNGEKAYVQTRILDQDVKVKLWQIDVGNTKLILMDTDIEENPPNLRDITHELYVTDREKRLQQELVIGFAGLKALELLNIKPKVYHINEGHSAFLVIARLQKLMNEQGLSFSEAKALVRASTVFTTHTPIVAGNENFKVELVRKYLSDDSKNKGPLFDELLAHGFIDDDKKIFWLPAMAISFAKHINSVSKMHRNVSRRMWAVLFRERPLIEIPIQYINNGIHGSWLSQPFTELLTRYIGPNYIYYGDKENCWEKINDISDAEIWEAHHKNKQNLVAFIRKKLQDDLAARGYIQSKIARLTQLLNPEFLTIVFARRFAHYKRATLILKNKERLRQILTNSRKPVQLIFAGKAHPADTTGKNMIKEIIDFAKDYQLEDRVIFLENYDMNVARHLVCGADIWLNTPLRENEASGTSGMKAAINGVLNLSVLDGWWPEGYNGKNGWAITAGEFYQHSELQETAEANQIYDLLEEEITELYYERNEMGTPKGWVKMMKESICSVCRKFNMNRVLKEYADKLYLPAKQSYEELCRNDFKHLRDATTQGQQLAKYWEDIKFIEFSTSAENKDKLMDGDILNAQCVLDLAQAPDDLVYVELCYLYENQNALKTIPMKLKERKGTFAYYECSLAIEGYGLQQINVRIKPANETLQDIHPELVKWLW